MVARVAVAALVLIVGRRIRFEIRARQVIQNSDILPVDMMAGQSVRPTRALIPSSFFIRFTRCMAIL
jgi:hypothetical protein